MNVWDQLVDAICRPPRDVYNAQHDLLGGPTGTFFVGQMQAFRSDYTLTNGEGQVMQCSHYLPLDAQGRDGKLPAVVYCHCNSGSRRDAEEAVWHLLPMGVGVVAFDFTGSGLSEGKWVTLGAREVEDLAAVVAHLRGQGSVSSIGLWGRSMGAVTALLYSQRDPDIAGMVLDSPFSRLTDLMLELVVQQQLPIPRVMLKLALRLMRSSVRRKAGADIAAVAPLDLVPGSAIPAMFGHGQEDSFIDIAHSVKLHAAYNTAAPQQVYKNLVRFRGDHNHPRPSFFYSSVCCFFHQQLKLDAVLLGGNPADASQLLRYGSLEMAGEPPEQVDRANGFIRTPWSVDSMPQAADLGAADAAAALLAAEGCPLSEALALQPASPLAEPGGLNSPRAGGRAAGAGGLFAQAAAAGAAPPAEPRAAAGSRRSCDPRPAGAPQRRQPLQQLAGSAPAASSSWQHARSGPPSQGQGIPAPKQPAGLAAADAFELGSRGGTPGLMAAELAGAEAPAAAPASSSGSRGGSSSGDGLELLAAPAAGSAASQAEAPEQARPEQQQQQQPAPLSWEEQEAEQLARAIELSLRECSGD